jgi:hypothetical protein
MNNKKSSIKRVSFSKFMELRFQYLLVGWEQQRDPFHPTGSRIQLAAVY